MNYCLFAQLFFAGDIDGFCVVSLASTFMRCAAKVCVCKRRLIDFSSSNSSRTDVCNNRRLEGLASQVGHAAL
jgi:hypothetical protein